MTAKNYLLKIQRLQSMIANKEDRLELLRSRLTSPAVGEMKQDKVLSSIDLRKQENLMVECAELEEEVKALYALERVQREKISRQIDGLKAANNKRAGLYSRLLYLRYEEDLPLRDIAVRLNYSEDHIRHLHGLALIEFTKMYTDDMI